MAERRMFAKAVINSARFLRMPATSRLLYYDLGMQADDDGVVEAFTVLRTTGATEDDLRVLATKGFITVLNDDLVSYIIDWNTNNQLRKDRYHPSVYAELLVKLTDGNQAETVGLPDGNQMEPESSIGKSSRVKEREAAKPPIPTRKKFGEYGWVKLTESEYSNLLADLGQAELDRCIRYIDECAECTQNKNRWSRWSAVLRRCSRDGWGRQRGTDSEIGPAPKAKRYEIIDGEAVEVSGDEQ